MPVTKGAIEFTHALGFCMVCTDRLVAVYAAASWYWQCACVIYYYYHLLCLCFCPCLKATGERSVSPHLQSVHCFCLLPDMAQVLPHPVG
jgi:hypothetical protein